MPVPLIATKLEPPPLPPTYVPRDRVCALLSVGAQEWRQLTLVSAPPGYGKTMAVRGWLAAQDRPFAWLGLDPADDDPARLVRYLIGAFQRVRPSIGAAASTLFGTAGLPSLDLVAATLLDEVAASAAPFVLVLDDYHLLSSDTAQRLVAQLVAHAPPFAQVVIVTRQDPPFSLARMRAHGRLVEVRADELRHSEPEARAFLAALGVALAPESVGLLTDRTEGWAAGLQLAALALSGRGDPDAVATGFGATHRYLIDYLADEVLAQLPDELRRFLERTSVADRLCAGLAEALSGTPDAGRMLREVERRNLFLLPLDAVHAWYRYHHLFGDYLRNRLDDEERRALLFRAAQWCACQGRDFAGEATRYAIAAQRWPDAVPIVAEGCRAALELGEPAGVLRWTDAVPEATLRASANLLADRAWAAYLTGEMAAFTGSTEELARLDVAGAADGSAAGRADGARAWHAVLRGDPEQAERLARRGLRMLGEDPFFRGLTLLALSDACWDLGRTEENAAAVAEALRIARDRPPTLATYFTAYVFALGSNEQGRRAEAETVCRQVLDGAADASGRMTPAAGPLRVGYAMLRYEANDLEVAAREIEAGFAMCRRLGMDAILGGESRRARAMIRLATAGRDAAGAAAEEGLRGAGRFVPHTRLPAAETLAALVALRTGDRRRALDWAQSVLADPSRAETKPPNVRLYRDLTLARVLLGNGAADRAEAVALEAGRYAVWAGTVLGHIEARLIAACAAERLGRRAEARSRLADAVGLAVPGGYVRRFVEDAAQVAHLLPTVRSGAETFVDAVMDALEAESVRLAPGRSTAGSAWRAEDGALLELLTQRELEVLRLLAGGRSNAAIGDALGVSPGTAKWHVANVLGKLGAPNRTQAAARARDLGLA